MAKESTLLLNIFNKLDELKKEQTVNHLPLQKLESLYGEIMTPKEVAIFFKRHKDTINNWTKKGYLKKYGIGRAVYYKRSEVESSIERLR